MKSFAVALVALVAAAVAVPTESHRPPPDHCIPATYACATNPDTGVDGWQVCDVTASWVYAGDCPPGTECKFFEANGSPYCLPK